MTLDAIGFESLYPSAELNFHATGLIHRVNRRGHSASPCGRPRLNRMDDDISFPFTVCAAIFVFQLSHSLPTTSHIHLGNLWSNMIFFNQSWSTQSFAHIYPCNTEVALVSMTVQSDHTIYHEIISRATIFRFRSSLDLFH